MPENTQTDKKMLRITLVTSGIGYTKRHKAPCERSVSTACTRRSSTWIAFAARNAL